MNDPWLHKFPELKNINSHPPFDCVRKAVRTKRYKYIWSSDGKHELYDLLNDPKEKFNKIDDCPEVATKLKKVLFDIVKTTDVKEDHERTYEIEEKLKKALESLGYL